MLKSCAQSLACRGLALSVAIACLLQQSQTSAQELSPAKYVIAASSGGFDGPFIQRFDLLTSGDCVLQQGQLILNPGGSGEWEAYIHTNHTTNRDIWHMNFVALDAGGNQLFSISVGDSPNMYGSPSPTIPWAVDFQFPARLLPKVASVRIARNSC
jgi:hypothetical protein